MIIDLFRYYHVLVAFVAFGPDLLVFFKFLFTLYQKM